jgi:hypothetical protein
MLCYASKVHTAAWYVGGGGDLFALLVDMTGSVGGQGGGAVHKFRVASSGATQHVASTSVAAPNRPTKPIAMGSNGGRDTYFVTDAKGGGTFLDAATMSVVKRVEPSAMGQATAPPAPIAPPLAPVPASRAAHTHRHPPQCAGGGGLWVEAHPSLDHVVVAQSPSESRTRNLLAPGPISWPGLAWRASPRLGSPLEFVSWHLAECTACRRRSAGTP